jgi:hypothetical protein
LAADRCTLPNLGTTIVSTTSYQRDMAWGKKKETLRYCSCGWRSGTTEFGTEQPKSIMFEGFLQ